VLDAATMQLGQQCRNRAVAPRFRLPIHVDVRHEDSFERQCGYNLGDLQPAPLVFRAPVDLALTRQAQSLHSRASVLDVLVEDNGGAKEVGVWVQGHVGP
jgi:hypothetical protein